MIASRTGLLVAAMGIALGAAALALIPAQIPGESLAAIGDMRSPAFFLILAALLSLAAGLALLPAAFRPGEEEAPPHPRRAVTLAVLLTGGAVLTPVLGGLLVIFLLMLAVGWVLGDRRPLRMLILAAVSVGVVHVLFERTLKVLLPAGMLF